MAGIRGALVIGLGNPILSDDGIGWRVAHYLRSNAPEAADLPAAITVDIVEAALGGLSLAEMMVGYDCVVVVDAMVTQQAPPGTVSCLSLADLPGTLNSASAHDTNLVTALEALRRFGAPLPPQTRIYLVAVEAQDVLTFREGCSPAVEQAIPLAARRVVECLRRVQDGREDARTGEICP